MAAICVFCSSARDIDPSYLELAAEVGARIGAPAAAPNRADPGYFTATRLTGAPAAP